MHGFVSQTGIFCLQAPPAALVGSAVLEKAWKRSAAVCIMAFIIGPRGLSGPSKKFIHKKDIIFIML